MCKSNISTDCTTAPYASSLLNCSEIRCAGTAGVGFVCKNIDLNAYASDTHFIIQGRQTDNLCGNKKHPTCSCWITDKKITHKLSIKRILKTLLQGQLETSQCEVYTKSDNLLLKSNLQVVISVGKNQWSLAANEEPAFILSGSDQGLVVGKINLEFNFDR